MRILAIVATFALTACGVNGPPLPPDGAIEPVAAQGSGLTGDLEGI